MLLAKRSVQGVVVLCWVVLWFVAVGLNGWRLEVESPVSSAVSALACFIMAGLTLAMLLSGRARRALADPEADVPRAWLHLALFAAGFAYAGVVMVMWAVQNW